MGVWSSIKTFMTQFGRPVLEVLAPPLAVAIQLGEMIWVNGNGQTKKQFAIDSFSHYVDQLQNAGLITNEKAQFAKDNSEALIEWAWNQLTAKGAINVGKDKVVDTEVPELPNLVSVVPIDTAKAESGVVIARGYLKFVQGG